MEIKLVYLAKCLNIVLSLLQQHRQYEWMLDSNRCQQIPPFLRTSIPRAGTQKRYLPENRHHFKSRPSRNTKSIEVSRITLKISNATASMKSLSVLYLDDAMLAKIFSKWNISEVGRTLSRSSSAKVESCSAVVKMTKLNPCIVERSFKNGPYEPLSCDFQLVRSEGKTVESSTWCNIHSVRHSMFSDTEVNGSSARNCQAPWLYQNIILRLQFQTLLKNLKQIFFWFQVLHMLVVFENTHTIGGRRIRYTEVQNHP